MAGDVAEAIDGGADAVAVGGEVGGRRIEGAVAVRPEAEVVLRTATAQRIRAAGSS